MSEEVRAAYERVLKFIIERQAEYTECAEQDAAEGRQWVNQTVYAFLKNGMAEVATAIEGWVGMQYAESGKWVPLDEEDMEVDELIFA